MNDIGDIITKLLIDNPQFIPFYLIILWFFIIKPRLKGTNANESSADKQHEDGTAEKDDIKP